MDDKQVVVGGQKDVTDMYNAFINEDRSIHLHYIKVNGKDLGEAE